MTESLGHGPKTESEFQPIAQAATSDFEKAKEMQTTYRNRVSELTKNITESGEAIKEASVGNYSSAQMAVYRAYAQKQKDLLHSVREDIEQPLILRDRKIAKGEKKSKAATEKLSKDNKVLGLFSKKVETRVREAAREMRSLQKISSNLNSQHEEIDSKMKKIGVQTQQLHAMARNTMDSLEAIHDQKKEVKRVIDELTETAKNVDKETAKELANHIKGLQAQTQELKDLEKTIKSQDFGVEQAQSYQNFRLTFDNIWMKNFAQFQGNIRHRVASANQALENAKPREATFISRIIPGKSERSFTLSPIELKEVAVPQGTRAQSAPSVRQTLPKSEGSSQPSARLPRGLATLSPPPPLTPPPPLKSQQPPLLPPRPEQGEKASGFTTFPHYGPSGSPTPPSPLSTTKSTISQPKKEEVPLSAKTFSEGVQTKPKGEQAKPKKATSPSDLKARLKTISDVREAYQYKSKQIDDKVAENLIRKAIKSSSKAFKQAKQSPEAMDQLFDTYVSTVLSRREFQQSKEVKKFQEKFEESFPQIRLQGDYHLQRLASNRMQTANLERQNLGAANRQKMKSDLPELRGKIRDLKLEYEKAGVREMPEGRLKAKLHDDLTLMERLTAPHLSEEEELQLLEQWALRNEVPANIMQSLVSSFNDAFGKDHLVKEGADATKLRNALEKLKFADPKNTNAYTRASAFVTDVEQLVNLAHKSLYETKEKQSVARTDLSEERRAAVQETISSTQRELIEKYKDLELPPSAITSVQFSQLVGSLRDILNLTLKRV